MSEECITQERLKELLEYNKNTGIFYWRINKQSRKAGTVAGHINKYGYVRIMLDKRQYQAHRLAWLYCYGSFPVEQIDHINHNKSDNRICNLREASEVDNHKNRPKQLNNTSGCTGVSWYKPTSKWGAYIQVNGKSITLGYFSSFTEAVKARKEAEIKYGFSKRHGK